MGLLTGEGGASTEMESGAEAGEGLAEDFLGEVQCRFHRSCVSSGGGIVNLEGGGGTGAAEISCGRGGSR